MKVTEVRITKVNEKGALKAFASVCFDDILVVDGFRVIAKGENLSVFFPDKSAKQEDGTYKHRNMVYSLNQDLRNEIVEAVKTEYNK